MTIQEASSEWQAVASYFKRWVQKRGADAIVRSDQRSFANCVVEAEIEGLRMRLVCDRNTILFDVSVGTDWHSGRTILAYDGRLSAAAAARSTQPDGAVLTLSIPHIKRILRDRRFAAFEDEMNDLSLQRLSSSGIDQRSRAHA